MAIETFSPPVQPAYSSSKKTECDVLENKFGDGYTQRAANGINSIKQTWDLEWHYLSYTNADTIETFFIGKGGHTPFKWTPLRAATPLVFRCKEWSRSYDAKNHDCIRATLEQVFDIE